MWGEIRSKTPTSPTALQSLWGTGLTLAELFESFCSLHRRYALLSGKGLDPDGKIARAMMDRLMQLNVITAAVAARNPAAAAEYARVQAVGHERIGVVLNRIELTDDEVAAMGLGETMQQRPEGPPQHRRDQAS
jgi:hypothetical protein